MQEQLWNSSLDAIARKDQKEAKEEQQAGIPTTVEDIKKKEDEKEIKKSATTI